MCKIEMKTSEIIRIASEAGVKAALSTLEKKKRESIKQYHDRRLHNTKLLLKNYRALHEHINNAVFEKDKLENYKRESPYDILELMWHEKDSDVIVESIKESITRTKIIMAHIDSMLELYETFCIKSHKDEDRRRWRVTKAMYITPEILSAEEIAKAEHIDKRTVYRDIDVAVERISALIFGINGLKNA